MFRKTMIAAFVLSTVFAACHKKKSTGSSTPSLSGDVKEIKTDAAANMSATGAAYKIDSLAINGDVLSVFVNYSGGCKDHSFEMISNGMFAKSMPPQLPLCLKHTNNEDMCKKLVMEELKFDLKSVRYKTGQSMIVKVGDKSANYNY